MHARSDSSRIVGATLSALLVLLPCAAPAQLGDLVAIREAAGRASARNRELAERAGPDFQPRALELIRRSCATRGVTRLDEIPPVEVAGQAAIAAVQALLEFDLRSGPTLASPAAAASAADAPTSPAPNAASPLTPATESPSTPATASPSMPASKPLSPAAAAPPFAAVDKDTDVEASARGVVLRRGQLRTTTSFAIARDAIGTIEIDVATTAPGQLLLGWNEAADAPRLRRNNARIELVGDGRVHTYAVDAASALARGLKAGSSVRRFFLATRGAAPLVIQGLRVLSRSQRFAAGPFGSSHEARGGQLRSVLYQRPPTTLTWDIDVPAQSPVLETGLGIVATDGVLEFEITIQDGDTRAVPLKRLVQNAPWEDIAIDLGAWAGKRIRISLSARGSRDAVALWSSPLVRPRLGVEATEPFVVLLEDALRADRLSVYGGPVAAPAHERLATAGVVFERAFAQATQTRSSVPSLMTSLLPSSNGTWDFSDALSERYVTLAEALRACGFATASFLQNGNAGPYAGLAQGFDVVFTEENSGPRAADLVAEGSPLDHWISAQRGRPWFAYVHVLDPHGPYDPTERPDLAPALAEAGLPRDRSIDATWLERPTAAARRLLYDAEVATNDKAIAGFLDRLDARGDLARAVVAVIADHGEFLGEHGGLWRHHPPGHVEVARVPFLLRAPGAAPSRITTPVALLDLMPTLLELARADTSGLVMQGTSLAGTLQGSPAPARAIPADEMIADEGERRARGCGSFVTGDSLWLLSCTRDEDFSPARLLAVRSGEPAPLRRIHLDASHFGEENTPGTLSRAIVEGAGRGALTEVQQSGLEAWRRMTAAGAELIVTEPGNAERLRALGYTE